MDVRADDGDDGSAAPGRVSRGRLQRRHDTPVCREDPPEGRGRTGASMKLARTLAFLFVLVTPLAAQVPVPTGDDPKNEAQLTKQKDDGSVEAPDWQLQIQQLQHALVRL